MDRVKGRVIGAAALVALVAALIHLVPDEGTKQWISNIGYVVGTAVSARWAWAGARRRKGLSRRGWQLIAAAQGAFLVANAIWAWHESVLRVPIAVPSIFDPFYALAMFLMLAGLGVLVAPRLRSASPTRVVLDVLLVVTGLFYVVWTTVLHDLPGLGWSAERAITWLYPACDLALAGLALLGLSRSDRAGRSKWLLLGMGVLAMAGADLIWAYANLNGMFESGSPLDALWLLGYLAIGLAALVELGPEPDDGVAAVSERWTAVIPYLPVVLVMVGVDGSFGADADPVRTTLCVAVMALLCLRQVAAVLENQRLARELECRVASRTAELARSEAMFRAVGDRISDAVVVLGADMIVRYASPGLARIAGYGPDDLVGSGTLRLVHPDDRAEVVALTAKVVAAHDATEMLRCRVTRHDGSYGHAEITLANMLDHPEIAGLLLVIRDMSDQRALEDRLRHRAEHDSLTDLANREALAEALAARIAMGEQPSVVLLDLDGFKALNDSLGHAAGDQLLRVVATRLRRAVRPRDVVARLGGDEFAVVTDGGHQQAYGIALRITELLDEPVAVGGRAVRCRASLGVATQGASADELIRNADLAMYEAKAAGRNRVAMFEDRLHQRLVRRIRLEEALAGAVERDELRLVFQPVVDLESGALHGGEALLRWRHEGEDISPAEFIPLAEETGLITGIGRWVLREACAAAAVWYRLRPDGPLPRVAVNVSAHQLGSGQLVGDVADALAASGLPASCLTIEITESAVMERSEDIVARLAALRATGIRVSIDDFGTGHSSLGRLRFLPVDEVKIDRSFVSDPDGGVDLAVVEAVLALAGSLGLDVVAEGIETTEQLGILRARGCEAGQGFLFGPGLPSADLERMLLEVDNGALNFSV